MRVNTVRNLILVCASAILSVGCAGQVANVNSVSFQDGAALTNDQILLTNIIASAHHRAPTFIAPQNVSSTTEGDASLGAQLSTFSVADVFTPRVAARRLQTVAIVDYGGSKAADVLYEPLPFKVARQVLTRGWDPQVTDTIMYKGLLINKELYELVSVVADDECGRNDDYWCQWVRRQPPDCKNPVSGFGPVYYFSNTGRDLCEFNRYQVALIKLFLSGTNFRLKEDENSKESLNLVFENTEIENLFERLKAHPDDDDFEIVRFFIRSPAEIVQFAGKLTALQLYNEPPVVANVPTPDGPTVLFRVFQGADSGAAISVRTGFGNYYIPQVNPIAAERDRSLQVMAFLIELQNRSRKEAPIQGSSIAILQ